jgi:hypothetical protein
MICYWAKPNNDNIEEIPIFTFKGEAMSAGAIIAILSVVAILGTLGYLIILLGRRKDDL